MIIRLFLSLLLLALLPSLAVTAEMLKVIVKESALRKDCSFNSPVTVKVKYNDQVELLSQEGDWFRVSSGGKRGCIHKSAVQEKSFSLSGLFGSGGSTASRDEVAVAGKGFNPEVERSYRSKHPQLDFKTVDQIEQYRVSEDSLRQFTSAGGLRQP